MDMDERKRQIQIKLAANKQRLARQDYLAELPECLGTYLEGCSYLQTPEFDGILPMFIAYPQGVAPRASDEERTSYFKPEGYIYREFSWPHQLLQAALSISDQHDIEEALFYPFAGPLYVVPFGWVRTNLAALFDCKSGVADVFPHQRYSPRRLGVISRDFKAGLILDQYAGYLEEDPNPDETIYQLAMWGFREPDDV